MNLKDKRILYELDLNGRATCSEIGKKVGLSKETTNNRLKALEKAGIISGYNTIINIAQLGYTGYAVFTRFQNITEERKQEITEDLKQNNHVYWIALLGGNYDLLFAIQAKNILEFNKIYEGIQNKYNLFLKDNVISIRLQVNQFRRKYLLDAKPIEEPPFFGKEIKETKIDKIDKDTLNIISNNARVNIVEIANKLNIARTTIHNRLMGLKKSGIIQGFSTLIHSEKYNYQIYQLMISVNSIDEKIKKRIYTYCLNHPNITFYVDSVGKWNFEITCEVENQEKLQEILTELKTTFQEIIVNIEIILTFNYYVKYKLYVE